MSDSTKKDNILLREGVALSMTDYNIFHDPQHDIEADELVKEIGRMLDNMEPSIFDDD